MQANGEARRRTRPCLRACVAWHPPRASGCIKRGARDEVGAVVCGRRRSKRGSCGWHSGHRSHRQVTLFPVARNRRRVGLPSGPREVFGTGGAQPGREPEQIRQVRARRRTAGGATTGPGVFACVPESAPPRQGAAPGKWSGAKRRRGCLPGRSLPMRSRIGARLGGTVRGFTREQMRHAPSRICEIPNVTRQRKGKGVLP